MLGQAGSIPGIIHRDTGENRVGRDIRDPGAPSPWRMTVATRYLDHQEKEASLFRKKNTLTGLSRTYG